MAGIAFLRPGHIVGEESVARCSSVRTDKRWAAAPMGRGITHRIARNNQYEQFLAFVNAELLVNVLTAPNKDSSGDQNGTIAAGTIRNEYHVPIYGVLHSPTKAQEANAEAIMTAVCGEGNLFRSTNTDTFGEAMNKHSRRLMETIL